MIIVAEQKQVIFPLPSYKTNTWSSKSIRRSNIRS